MSYAYSARGVHVDHPSPPRQSRRARLHPRRRLSQGAHRRLETVGGIAGLRHLQSGHRCRLLGTGHGEGLFEGARTAAKPPAAQSRGISFVRPLPLRRIPFHLCHR
eukprot:scaffold13628_cov31-Tisochrysis_lutea.AAC.6